MRRHLLLSIVLLTCMIGLPVGSVSAATDICFPNQPGVTDCLTDPFAAYWRANGGLPVFGYPITKAQPDPATNLNTQWTERNRLEFHPNNSAPYRVLLGRMGAERLAQLGRDPAQEGRESGPRPGCLWFEETGHNVCDQENRRGFRTYWERNGLRIPGLNAYNRSLQLFGLPLTAAKMEPGSDGKPVMTQWFERVRFEWRPDNPNQFKVQLGLLGREVRTNLAAPPATQPAAQPIPPSIFGGEINPGSVNANLGRVGEAGIAWVRYGGILWSNVESQQGARDWSKLAEVEAELKALAAQGTRTMIMVRSAPAWAQQTPDSACGPIKPEALDQFAGFMGELVSRYSRAPYNVKHWEIWNEPDVDVRAVSGDSPFGCWGNWDDPFYGGGYYAEMLKRVYPAIKAADPESQVLLGGLLLDCDPTNPPPGKSCQPALFLEGILQNGGGAAFDILAYHGYPLWNPARSDWDLDFAPWKARGGVVLGKLSFLREVMARYQVNKPILLNEGGLICYDRCPRDPLATDQANYAVRLYTRTWANGLIGTVWYTLTGPGWRSGGLLDENQQPRPAFRTIQFMSGLLRGATFAGVVEVAGGEGYEFHKGAARYRILWTNSEQAVETPLPAGTQALYNMLGQPITPSGANVTVGFEPIFVQFAAPSS